MFLSGGRNDLKSCCFDQVQKNRSSISGVKQTYILLQVDFVQGQIEKINLVWRKFHASVLYLLKNEKFLTSLARRDITSRGHMFNVRMRTCLRASRTSELWSLTACRTTRWPLLSWCSLVLSVVRCCLLPSSLRRVHHMVSKNILNGNL